MMDLAHYMPGPANIARIHKKEGQQWTMIVTRELPHAPEKVWQALTDPAHLREWAPFDADRRIDREGDTVKLTWAATQAVTEVRVTQAEAPRVLELHNMRWELEARGSGTRLTLWHTIPNRYVAWGAAGWQISLDVMDRLLAGTPIGRIAGPNAMQFEGFQRLAAEYRKQFDAEGH
jgi:uncharacterized protein YndB with AHSA1/START domain